MINRINELIANTPIAYRDAVMPQYDAMKRAVTTPNKLIMAYAGLYYIFDGTSLYEIEKNYERDSSWFGQWIRRNVFNRNDYSDPTNRMKDLL